MASITDCVVEGLKYPFNDIKKLLGFGIFFVILELLAVFFTVKSFGIFRAFVDLTEKSNVSVHALKFSMLPNGDIYAAIGILIVGFIVALFIGGYQYNVIKFSIDKENGLPGFGNVLDMFINGAKYFIVSLAYSLPAMIVMFVGLMMSGDMSIMPVVMAISCILIIICYFILVMALNNMIAHDSLKKAFDFHEIIENISNLGWGKYVGILLFTIIVFMIINAAAGFVLSILTVIFAAAINNQAFVISIFITIIEALFVSSYCTVFYNRVCGSIYRESIK